MIKIAFDQDHHPEIHVHYNFVKVRITDYEHGSFSAKCQGFVTAVNQVG